MENLFVLGNRRKRFPHCKMEDLQEPLRVSVLFISISKGMEQSSAAKAAMDSVALVPKIPIYTNCLHTSFKHTRLGFRYNYELHEF